MENTKVSIWCLTYNHAAYIKEALDGFLMQKTNFDFNVLIYDDASTDGTSDIVREYQKKYPDIIHAYISPVNTYGKPERRKILHDLYDQYLTGEYIACCEGDDAWTCEDKLQLQVDFLDKNADCIMTTHAYKRIDYAENKTIPQHLCSENRYLLPEEVILRISGSIATASLVARKKVFFRASGGFPECDVGDIPVHFYSIYHGDIYYFNKEMSIYRYMHKGSWSKEFNGNYEKATCHKLCFMDFLMKYNAYTHERFEKLVWQLMLRYFYDTVSVLCKVNKTETFIRNISRKSNHIYDSLIEEIIPVHDWMSGNYQMDNHTKEMVSKYEHICIMGKGNYSKFIVSGLEKSGIRYDGYLLSQKEEGCKEPNVWDVLDFPYNKEATLLIVGISQTQEEGITKTLKKCGFKNVWCPLWFHKEKFGAQNQKRLED